MSEIQETKDIDYSYSFLLSPKWIFGILLFFILTVLSYIPLKKYMDALIYSKLVFGPGCQVKVKNYHFEWFAPKLVLEKTKIPGTCFGETLPSGLLLDTTKVYFRGLSFSPFGLSARIDTNIFQSEIETYIIAGFNGLSVILESESKDGKFISETNKIKISSLNKLLPSLEVKGDLYLSNILVSMGYIGELSKVVVNIASKNLQLPAQQVEIPSPMGGGTLPLGIPDMPINSFLLQATSDDGKNIEISDFIVGDDNSPIRAQFSGQLALELRQIMLSQLNISGELGFSDEFLENFAIIQAFLSSFDKKDNFYQIQVKGTLGSPQASSAR